MKNAKTKHVIIAVVLIALLAGLSVGGYFLLQHFKAKDKPEKPPIKKYKPRPKPKTPEDKPEAEISPEAVKERKRLEEEERIRKEAVKPQLPVSEQEKEEEEEIRKKQQKEQDLRDEEERKHKEEEKKEEEQKEEIRKKQQKAAEEAQKRKEQQEENRRRKAKEEEERKQKEIEDAKARAEKEQKLKEQLEKERIEREEEEAKIAEQNKKIIDPYINNLKNTFKDVKSDISLDNLVKQDFPKFDLPKTALLPKAPGFCSSMEKKTSFEYKKSNLADPFLKEGFFKCDSPAELNNAQENAKEYLAKNHIKTIAMDAFQVECEALIEMGDKTTKFVIYLDEHPPNRDYLYEQDRKILTIDSSLSTIQFYLIADLNMTRINAPYLQLKKCFEEGSSFVGNLAESDNRIKKYENSIIETNMLLSLYPKLAYNLMMARSMNVTPIDNWCAPLYFERVAYEALRPWMQVAKLSSPTYYRDLYKLASNTPKETHFHGIVEVDLKFLHNFKPWQSLNYPVMGWDDAKTIYTTDRQDWSTIAQDLHYNAMELHSNDSLYQPMMALASNVNEHFESKSLDEQKQSLLKIFMGIAQLDREILEFEADCRSLQVRNCIDAFEALGIWSRQCALFEPVVAEACDKDKLKGLEDVIVGAHYDFFQARYKTHIDNLEASRKKYESLRDQMISEVRNGNSLYRFRFVEIKMHVKKMIALDYTSFTLTELFDIVCERAKMMFLNICIYKELVHARYLNHIGALVRLSVEDEGNNKKALKKIKTLYPKVTAKIDGLLLSLLTNKTLLDLVKDGDDEAKTRALFQVLKDKDCNLMKILNEVDQVMVEIEAQKCNPLPTYCQYIKDSFIEERKKREEWEKSKLK